MAAQHDYTFEDQTGPQIRSDLNNAMLAIVGKNWGPSEPTTTFKYMWWLDTTANLLKIRNAFNTAWIEVGDPNAANFGLAKLTNGKVPINLGGTGESTASAAWDALKKIATSTVEGAVLLPRGHLSGCKLAPNDTATLSIGAGQCVDGTIARMFNILALNKTNGAWVVGDAAGGLDTGTIANNSGYHVWAILRSDTGVTDYLISLSATAPIMPTDYDFKRRIGHVRTDGSGNFIADIYNGDFVELKAPIESLTAVTSTATLRTLEVPNGIIVRAKINVQHITTTGFAQTQYWNPALGAVALAGIGRLYDASQGDAQSGYGAELEVYTNAAKQIYTILSTGNTSIYNGYTLGYFDRRGKDD